MHKESINLNVIIKSSGLQSVGLEKIKQRKLLNLYVSACVRQYWDNPDHYTYLSVHKCISYINLVYIKIELSSLYYYYCYIIMILCMIDVKV